MDYNKAFNLPQSYYDNINKEIEAKERVKLPANAKCNKCNRIYGVDIVGYNMVCDNGCGTRHCKCGNEYYFEYGKYHEGHDVNCGVGDDY